MNKSRSTYGWSSSLRNKADDYSSLEFLVVDDDPGIRSIISDVLRTSGAKDIGTASNGTEAASHLVSNPDRYAAILCDCQMSPGNGLELLAALRQGKIKGIDPETPFIMITGYGEMPIVKKAMELRVSGFLAKPVSLEKLTKAVNKALSLKAEN